MGAHRQLATPLPESVTGGIDPMNRIERSDVSRSLAKAIAYHECGKAKEAGEWARKLVHQLQQSHILKG